MTILACPKCGLHLCSDTKGMCAVCEKERNKRGMMFVSLASCLLLIFWLL